MRYGKLVVLGTILAACAPAALADRLYGTIETTGGDAAVSAASTRFGSAVPATGGKTPTGAPTGKVGDGTGNFSEFTSSASSFDYILSNVVNPTTLTYASVNGGTAVKLYTITEDGSTLTLYITHIDLSSVVVTSGSTSTAATGAFTGEGYVVVTGNSNSHDNTTDTSVDITFANTAGTRGTQFTLTAVAAAPEPSSLALLGTGMLSAAGMLFRRRRIA